MESTIAAGFQKLRNNLQITGLQTATVSTRQKNVRAAVADGLDVLSSFVAGSYARSTMISPLKESDIDLFVVLHPKYFKTYTPAQLLDRVRTILKRKYPETPKISRNGQAVTITFTDFMVDVVPSYNRQGGGYLIPDSHADAWIPTNPDSHKNHITNANKCHDGDLVPLIKMVKGWNRCINGAFVSFYLELMTAEMLRNVTIDSHSSGVRFVLGKGMDRVKTKIKDPSEYGGQINPVGCVSNVDDAVSRFTTAYNRAVKAEQFDKDGKIDLAFAEWRKIFPRYFPAYG